MTENAYQRQLVKRLKTRFADHKFVMIKNDPNYQQGILDWTLLIDDWWAMLEVKASRTARERPNQDYFVELLNGMTFAAFIFPENEEEVLDALQQAFETRGRSRVP